MKDKIMPNNKELENKVKMLEEKIKLMEKIKELEDRLRALENKSGWTYYNSGTTTTWPNFTPLKPGDTICQTS